jgi:hypothetical protein
MGACKDVLKPSNVVTNTKPHLSLEYEKKYWLDPIKNKPPEEDFIG